MRMPRRGKYKKGTTSSQHYLLPGVFVDDMSVPITISLTLCPLVLYAAIIRSSHHLLSRHYTVLTSPPHSHAHVIIRFSCHDTHTLTSLHGSHITFTHVITRFSHHLLSLSHHLLSLSHHLLSLIGGDCGRPGRRGGPRGGGRGLGDTSQEGEAACYESLL